MQPTLPLTDHEGKEIPPPPKELWRQHTGTTLARHHPEAHAHALELLRGGETLAETARIIGPLIGKTGPGETDGLRKIVLAWASAARIDRTEIRRVKAAFLAEEAIDKASELMAKTTARDLGSVAMTFTQAHQVERNLGGLPTEIKLTTKLTPADLAALLTQPPPPRDITPIIDMENDQVEARRE